MRRYQDSIPHNHYDVIKWKHVSLYWSFVRGIHRWPMDSPHKGKWSVALMFSQICPLANRGSFPLHINSYRFFNSDRWRNNIEKLSALLVVCERNPTVSHTKQQYRTFDVFFIVCLSKQSSCRWFDTYKCLCDVVILKTYYSRHVILAEIAPPTPSPRVWSYH